MGSSPIISTTTRQVSGDAATRALRTVAVPVELGDAGEALQVARTIDPSPLAPGLLERRAIFHLDVARAYGQRHNDAAAVATLLVHATQHMQLVVRLLQTLHVQRLDLLRRHQTALSSLPVFSPAARSIALVSRSRSRMIHCPFG